MFDNLDKYSVVLASNSPRRQSLLKELGVDFTVQSSQGDESYPDDLVPEKVAEFLARKKADWFTDFSKNQLYITADTVVISDNVVLGKPNSKAEAEQILQSLSGKTHEVITGVCLKAKDKTQSFHSITEVRFSDLSSEMISYYVEKYKPFDKAGSYGIQEWIGMVGIESIKGSYFNVVGLPTDKLFHQLKCIL